MAAFMPARAKIAAMAADKAQVPFPATQKPLSTNFLLGLFVFI